MESESKDLQQELGESLLKLFDSTPVQRVRALRRARDIYWILHPETKPGKSQGRPAERKAAGLGPETGPSRFSKFVADEATSRNLRGWSESQVDNFLRWSGRIDSEVLDAIEGTEKDKTGFLEELSRRGFEKDIEQRRLLQMAHLNGEPPPAPAQPLPVDGWWSNQPGVIDSAERFCVPDLVDLYQGDCTAVLPTDLQADLMLSDVPYGIGYNNSKGQKVLGDEDAVEAAKKLLPTILGLLRDDALAFVCSKWTVAPIWKAEAEAQGASKVDRIIWDKGRPSAGGDPRTEFNPCTEEVLVLHKRCPRLHSWVDTWGLTSTVGLRVDRDRELWTIPHDSFSGHVTPKPVALGLRMVLNGSEPDDLVCDPCCGHGPFVVAALRAGRRVVAAELDPDNFAAAVRAVKGELASLGRLAEAA